MEDQVQQSTSANIGLLKGWSKNEKLALLDCLKLYGSSCTEQIALSLPGKTEIEIKEAIFYYKEKSLKHPTYTSKKKKERKKVNTVSSVPLSSWAKVLTDSINFQELQTETAAALHILAEFEDFPSVPPGAPDYNIDFKKIYHTIGNALEGKALPQNKVIATVLEKCLLETALTSKAFIRKNTFKEVIGSLRLTAPYNSILARATPNTEVAYLRHLAAQKAYNPFNMGENALKQTIFSESIDADNVTND